MSSESGGAAWHPNFQWRQSSENIADWLSVVRMMQTTNAAAAGFWSMRYRQPEGHPAQGVDEGRDRDPEADGWARADQLRGDR
jgi:hypothetical protein